MSDIVAILLGLGDKLAAHVLLSAAAIGLGIAVALPLAVWASRSAAVARVVLGFASLVQTIPALALLALFFPILLSLRAVFGEGLPTLGFLPALRRHQAPPPRLCQLRVLPQRAAARSRRALSAAIRHADRA